MSSATSTDGSFFRPWHFFILAGVLAATVGVFLIRQSSAPNIVMVTIAIWAAGLAGLALHRTLVPLAGSDADVRTSVGERTREGLENEKALVLRSIKELEFDRAMGKIAAADFDEMVTLLRARAIGLLAQLDADGGDGYRDLIEREVRARLASEQVARAVPAPRADPPEDQSEDQSENVDPMDDHVDHVDHVDQPEHVDQSDPTATVTAPAATACSVCDTSNDADARFCKQCGHPLEEDRGA